MHSWLAWRIRFILPYLRRLRIRRKVHRRVLCIVTGGLGDKLMALPAIRNIRKEFSECEVTVMFTGGIPPFWESEANLLVSVPSPASAKRLQVAARGYDMCFVNSIALFDIWSEVCAFLTGAEDLRGPRAAVQPVSKTVYTRPFIFGESHETVDNFRGGGGFTENLSLEYPLKMPSREVCHSMSEYVVIHPGSSAFGIVNRWRPEAYAEVTCALSRRGFEVVLVGTPNELQLLESIKRTSEAQVKLRIDLSLDELALCLRDARLVIANDSGIGHLAASVGANVITIMGANRPERVAPVGKMVTVVGPRCPVGGCYGTPKAAECERCIDRITPQEVLCLAIEKLI